MESRNKILDPIGREIEVDGVQYNKYIKHGYKVSIDGTSLLSRKMKMLESFIVPEKVEKVEKPKGKAKTEKIISAKNPEIIIQRFTCDMSSFSRLLYIDILDTTHCVQDHNNIL